MSQSDEAAEFHVSERYRSYVVWLLFAVYVFNFVDRQILTILIQPIKAEFALSDTEVGLLGGIAFAFLYSTLGIPIARYADRANRVNIIGTSLLVWSLFTAATGFARSFGQLFIARVAVGIGEAGCSPAAYSIISDYFKPEKRSTALAIYSMGIYGGVFVGFLVGGTVAQAYGWRAAFYVVGLPGVLLALIVRLTLREPPRGFSEGVKVPPEPVPFRQVVGRLWAKPSFKHVSLAAALHAFVGYGVGGFYPAFLMRTHNMTVKEVGLWLSLITVVGGVTGTYLGGYLSDRYVKRFGDRRYQLWVPGISTLVSVPLSIIAYTLPMKAAVLWMLVPGLAIGAMYLGPTFAIGQSLVGAGERAVAGALLLLAINLIGLGFGPLLTGVFSDLFRARFLGQGMDDAHATMEGLRWSLCVMTFVNVWSTFHYMRAARTVREDLATATE